MSHGPTPEAQPPLHNPRLVLPTLIKIIAISQVWGAATGTWPVIQGLAEWGPSTPVATPLVLLGLLLFYTFLGATALFVLRGRESALFYLAAAQLPQLVQLETPDVVYRVLAGAFVLLHAGSGGLGIEFGLISTASIRWGDLPASTRMGVNVLAAATLWYLAVVYPSKASEGRRFPLRAAERLGRRDDSTTPE